MATGLLQKNLVLLWENPNPTASFAAQKVSVDLSDYAIVVVAYGTSNAADARLTHLIHEKERTSLCISLLNNKIVYRALDAFTDSGLTFNDGKNVSSYGSVANLNTAMIPVKIYGLRT